MIISIRKLDSLCGECGKFPATFQVERTNDDLPDGYIRRGTRMEDYCNTCLPLHMRMAWEHLSKKE